MLINILYFFNIVIIISIIIIEVSIKLSLSKYIALGEISFISGIMKWELEGHRTKNSPERIAYSVIKINIVIFIKFQ